MSRELASGVVLLELAFVARVKDDLQVGLHLDVEDRVLLAEGAVVDARLYLCRGEVMQVLGDPVELFACALLLDSLFEQDLPLFVLPQLLAEIIVLALQKLQVLLPGLEVVEVLPLVVAPEVFLDDDGLVVEVPEVPFVLSPESASLDEEPGEEASHDPLDLDGALGGSRR